MSNPEFQFAQLIWQIRRLFQRLTSESNDFLNAYDINASQRAVLEFLDHNEPETLANMARSHDVSRQHIQQIVNELLKKQLVQTVENPSHKRSFLVQRTDKGNELFARIKTAESELFKLMLKQFGGEEIENCLQTLTKFSDYLGSDAWEEEVKGKKLRNK